MERFNPVNPVNPDPLKSEINQPSTAQKQEPIKSATEQPFTLNQKPQFIGGPITSSDKPAGGPQFGSSEPSGWGKKTRDWLSKYGSSVILPIIAILILAGGIYLYATQRAEEIIPPKEEILPEITEEVPAITEEKPETISPTEEVVKEPEIKEIIPEPIKKEGQIIEKAVKGDGVTHLARRALKDYLADHPQEKELTKEHKIYIEDYLKDREGPRSLEINDEISFSEDLIQEAIDASLQLNADQLKTLEQYSALVVSW